MATELKNVRAQVSSSPQTYAVGVVLGAVIGFLASYFYARAAEEERRSGGQVQPMQVGQMLTLGLALLGLVRQISEMGRPTGGRRR